MVSLPVYLDNNATTACDPRVVEAMLPYFTRLYGNASSRANSFGWQAAAAVGVAREQVAQLINAAPEEIIFTSGATESCNLALRGIKEKYATKGAHIITTAVEHKAVLDTCKALEKTGASVTYLPVDASGIISVAALKAAITPTTILIATQYANNETGVIMPVSQIGAVAKQAGVLFFCDATQAVGKIKVDVAQEGIDLLALSAHKMYGPKGIGALYVRRRNPKVKITPQITGGGQEQEQRGGTLNVPAIVGLGKACAICVEHMDAEIEKLYMLRNRLEAALLQIEATRLNGNNSQRLPQVTNISFDGISSSMILSAISHSVAAASGSACTSGSLQPSHVLKAMGIPHDRAKGAIRLSVGRFTTKEEIDFAITTLQQVIEPLRSQSFEWQLYRQKH